MSEASSYVYKGYPAGLEYPWIFPQFSENERDRRWSALKRSMETQGVDCLLVGAAFGYMPSARHLHYLSNYYPHFNRGTFAVFPRRGDPQLVVTSALGPQFLHCAWETSWIRDIRGDSDPLQSVVEKLRQCQLAEGRIGIIGYRSGMFAASALDRLREQFPQATFSDATAVMGEAMNEVSRQSEEEQAFLKKACEILDLTFDAVASLMKPGVKECELWAAALEVMVRHGGWYPSFMLATSGPRPTFLRAPVSQYAIAPGDVVMFEVDAIYGGVAPQTFYALSLGRPARDVEEMFAFCAELYELSLAELEKRRTFREVHGALTRRIRQAGYVPMTPQIHIFNMSGDLPLDSPAQPGDYFTVHPNVCNADFTAGAKVGDTVRITAGGRVERMHRTPAELNVIAIPAA